MRIQDFAHQALKAIFSQPLRSSLIVLAMSIGISSVTVLTGLGESARNYVVNQFEALGTNLLIILPGRSETTGGQPPLFGETPRDLTLEDAQAIYSSPYIVAMAPVSVGVAPVSTRGLERETTIMGSTASLRKVRHLQMAQGRFLPASDIDRPSPVCVIGQTIKNEMFAGQSPLGQWLRINDRRFQVIGVLASEGRSIGVDFDEIVVVPVASAQMIFNNYSLFRILAEARSKQAMISGAENIRKVIQKRHDGEDDITLITQDSVVSTFDDILLALTFAVSSIAAISLLVAGVLVMNVMLVSVTQRTSEIGLLKALGATRRQLQFLFLTEAAILSLAGALLGVVLGKIMLQILQLAYPDFPFILPLWALFSALSVAMLTGLVFGVLPASKAAALNPVNALTKH